MNCLSSTWCDLSWTAWIPFTPPLAFKSLPSCPGIYRVRAVDGKELFYLGETGRNLRERLGDLRRNTMKTLMPYNDPHTAAPSLWAWRNELGMDFECSAAPVLLAEDPEEARKLREGLEFYLLWQYLLEYGSSIRCNHGRFPARYVKSTDRKKGFVGYRLLDDAPDNPAGGKSLPPLQLVETALDDHWMGLSWSSQTHLTRANLSKITKAPGVYKILDPDKKELLYVGETGSLRQRLRSHERKDWGCSTPLFSLVQLPADTQDYQRHERENDLLGGFFAQAKRLPKFQLIDHQEKNVPVLSNGEKKEARTV